MLKKWHRWLGLGLAFFWLVQLASGIGIELVWWLDGVKYRDVDAQPSTSALMHGLDTLRTEGATVASMWSTGTVASHARIFYSDNAGQSRIRRIDSAGNVLYDVPSDTMWTHEGVIRTVSDLHKTILVGVTGQMLVAVSGTFLVLSVLLGVQLALRGRVRLRQLFFWQPVKSAMVRKFQLHRMIGSWSAIPAFAMALTGALLAVTEGWQSIRPEIPDPKTIAEAVPAAPTAASEIGPARAIGLALDRVPGGHLSALVLPDATRPSYVVWVRAPDETLRFWGTTRVHVAQRGGAVGIVRSRDLVTVDHTAEVIYPFHTGQFGGLWMRIAALFVGLGFLATAVFGLLLWNARRKRPRPATR